MTEDQQEAFVNKLSQHLRDNFRISLPSDAEAIKETVTNITVSAEAGDIRLQETLNLLASDRPREAEKLLETVAETKTVDVDRNNTEVATAYHNLGVIAGLRDPELAHRAYTKAADCDPDDLRYQLQIGWSAKKNGNLGAAEKKFWYVLAEGTDQDWLQFSGRLGLAEIAAQRGNEVEALDAYRGAHAIAERLTVADPSNDEWQRALLESYKQLGNSLVQWSHRAEAVETYRQGLAIAERLAAGNPDNTEWQHNVGAFYDKIGEALGAAEDRTGALNAYRAAAAIYERLTASDPHNMNRHLDRALSYSKYAHALDAEADMLAAKGSRTAAWKARRASKAMRRTLVTKASFYLKWAKLLSERRNWTEALKFYKVARVFCEHFAHADPKSNRCRQDLVNLYDTIRDVEYIVDTTRHLLWRHNEMLLRAKNDTNFLC